MEKFIGRRVIQEFLDNSALDDAIIKQLLNEYIKRFDQLRSENSFEQVRYHQGFIAALDLVINIMRKEQRKNIVKEDEDSD